MQSYYLANIWDNKQFKAPYTSKKAHPVDYDFVQNLPVIDVIGANYRNASLSGKFVISPFSKTPFPTSGSGTIDVLCRWFDLRLASSGLSLIVDFGNVQFIPSYTGDDVISNIAK